MKEFNYFLINILNKSFKKKLLDLEILLFILNHR